MTATTTPGQSTTPVYYNEHDTHAAAWLFNLGESGLIPAGHVDTRDIQKVTPDDLRGFAQSHFFCGIGGWPLAFRLAGVPPTQSVWSGSCPCQPYSAAGKRKGDADARNLWPEFFRLIRECRPDTIFGEQVESAIAHGWLDGISADLEGEGYAVGSAVLGAHSVGAPHIRQRLYWVAESEGSRRRADLGAVRSGETAGLRIQEREDFGRASEQAGRLGDRGTTGGMAHARQQPSRPTLAGSGPEANPEPFRRGAEAVGEPGRRGGDCGMADPGRESVRGEGSGSPSGTPCGVQGADGKRQRFRLDAGPGRPFVDGRLEHAEGDGRIERGAESIGWGVAGGRGEGPWSRFDLVDCLDGKTRRVEPGSQCLVDGFSFRLADGRSRKDASRAAILKGFGNAIVPELAAEFIRAYLEVGS